MIRATGSRPLGYRQNGIGLVEILVTVFVLSIGLLGIAMLQAGSKKANFAAVQRTTAAMLASGILERMRLNAGQLGNYDGAAVGGRTITAEPSPNCLTTTCNPMQLAAHDLWEWEQKLDGASEIALDGSEAGGLASPTGCISGPGDGTSDVYSVAIAWRGRTAHANLNNNNGCGSGSGKYGAHDEFRRVLAITAYLGAG